MPSKPLPFPETPRPPEKILLVDDDPFILKALELTLTREGYIIFSAENGKEALAFMKEHPIALIICDQRLPGMSGVEILQNAQRLRPEAIRIALTAHHDLDTVLKAINIGQVSQFIVKPWEDVLLIQTVSASIERYRLLNENKNLHTLILSQHKELEKTHENLLSEMQLGARIHEELLLGKIPSELPGIAIAVATIPSKEIDGDFFDFFRPTSRMLDIVFGDVPGKGISAALIGTAVKTHLLRFAVPFNYGKICTNNEMWEDDLLKPHEILEHTHEEIAKQLLQLQFSVSLFYGRFDLLKNTLTYVDCGSTKPIHFKKHSNTIEVLEGQNYPVGMVEQNVYAECKTDCSEGDVFVFYSDGVTNTRSPEDEPYGQSRMMELLHTHHTKSAQEILDLIRLSVLTFSGKERFGDDLTLIVTKMLKNVYYQKMFPLTAKFAGTLSQLNAVRAFVNRICVNAPIEEAAFSELLQLAINEAFCNIVKHSQKNHTEALEVVIRGEYLEDGLSFEISDQGAGFDPAEIPEPSLTGDREGGYGLYMIKQIIDRVTYVRRSTKKGWNHLSLFKRYLKKEGSMEFTHTTQDNILIVTPAGHSLDAKEAREFKEKVLGLIESNACHRVVIDMHTMQFIDSSGLGSFLSILKNLHMQGGDLKLSQMNKPIRTIFELVSMHKIFEIYNTTDEALHSFN